MGARQEGTVGRSLDEGDAVSRPHRRAPGQVSLEETLPAVVWAGARNSWGWGFQSPAKRTTNGITRENAKEDAAANGLLQLGAVVGPRIPKPVKR